MKKEKFIKRFFVSKNFLFLGLIVLGLLFFAAGKKNMERRQIAKEVKIMEDDIARLEGKNAELGALLNYLNTEEFIEQEARLKFNLQKPGESVAILPEEKSQQENKNSSSSAREAEIAMSNPKKWWNYFFRN
jgi:cell division protein FtsB